MSNLTITMGTDPEVFFVTGQPQNVIPAAVVYRKVGYESPINLPTGRIIADGAAMELQPEATLGVPEMLENLAALIRWGDDVCTAYASETSRITRDGPNVAFWPEVPIDLDWCKQDPDLAVFGCDPDQSAWGEECRPATIDASKHPWRYAGCHIHLGVLGEPNYFRAEGQMHTNIKALDRTVGLASMVIADGNDHRRRGIYGRPGIYRHQPHGMEYRTPSNMILRSPKWMGFIFEIAVATVGLVSDGVYPELQAVIPDEALVWTLRSGNLDSAKEHYSRLASVFGLPSLPLVEPVNWRVEWLT